MDKRKKRAKSIKAVDELVTLPIKKGNGILRYTVSTNEKGEITRYSLAYINPLLYTGDNGRVLGYDNCHGRHHRHLMGKEENITFTSYEKLADRFEIEWRELHEKVKKQKR
jgi:hypothetical protein